MNKLNLQKITQYVENNIGIFHQKRIDSLKRLKLKTVLKKKNPYLFKAKYLLTAEQIVKGLTDAFISSNEETIFGDWLEGLAIFINSDFYETKSHAICSSSVAESAFSISGNNFLSSFLMCNSKRLPSSSRTSS